MKVATILVNWRQASRTLAAVTAITSQTTSSTVIVVENGSGDDSLRILRNGLPAGIHLIESHINGGFGSGCNYGIEFALSLGATHVWLINNDAIPHPSCLERLLATAASDEALGIVGAIIRDPTGVAPPHAGSIMGEFTLNSRHTSDPDTLNAARYAWVTGACMLIKVDALRHTGLFDGKFFMYWEDADLCARIKKAGWSLGIAQDAEVLHTAGTSSDHLGLLRFEWHMRSHTHWLRKHHRFYFVAIGMLYLRNFAKSILTWNVPRLRLTYAIARQARKSGF